MLFTQLYYLASHILDENILKILYYSLFYPHLEYCCEVWGILNYQATIHCLYLLQTLVIRTITHSEYLSNSMVLFYRL